VSPIRSQTVRFEDLSAGDKLPELKIPLTRTVIVATAIASRDYQDVHHDPGLAVARGSEDIFMNILSTNGLVGRFVTDWAGPGAVITDVSIRLGAPNYPGDVMVLSGQVERLSVVEPDSDGSGAAGKRGRVELAVRGSNSRGDHVTGTICLTLPLSPAEGP
jgi:hypothetical protein